MVLVEPGTRAALVEQRHRGVERGTGFGAGDVSVVGAEHDETHLVEIRNVGRRLREHVNALEHAAVAHLGLHEVADLIEDLMAARGAQLLGPVTSDLTDAGLGPVPVTGALRIQIGGTVRQSGESIAEHADRLTRQRGAEPDPLHLEPLVGRVLQRRRTEKHGAGRPAGGGVLAEIGVLIVDSAWHRVEAVDVALHDWRPALVEVGDQLGSDGGVVEGQAAGQDHR
jgi:hypothetical protein